MNTRFIKIIYGPSCYTLIHLFKFMYTNTVRDVKAVTESGILL